MTASLAISAQVTPLESDEEGFWYRYDIRIKNTGDETLQLVSRHWIIVDADGHQREVEGDGVVGQQPTIIPTSSFEYHSHVNFPTPVGTMHGSYTLLDGEANELQAEIPPILFAPPGMIN